MVYRHPHARAVPVSETIEAWVLIVSLVVGIYLLKTDIITSLVALAGDSYTVSSFIAGIFFTSVLTTVPAIVVLGEIGLHAPAWQVAIFGGLGSLVGDILIFRFIRSRLVEHIMRIGFSPRARRFGAWLSSGPLWWIPIVGGAIIIASPLPDEMGLLMLGLSKLRTWQFVPIALMANTIGIYAIAIVAQSLTS